MALVRGGIRNKFWGGLQLFITYANDYMNLSKE